MKTIYKKKILYKHFHRNIIEKQKLNFNFKRTNSRTLRFVFVVPIVCVCFYYSFEKIFF